MAITTRITIQQFVDLNDQDLVVSKFPKYIVNLGTSITGVTVGELADAVAKTTANALAAAASEAKAKTSETNAKTSETNAKTSETNANTSKIAAANSAAAALASQNAAKTSETNAKTSETNAKTSENAAKTSETNANASKVAAAASAAAALASQNAAKTSETNAKTSETNAASSAAAALVSQNAAKTSETNAKTSETNAKTSETNAATSATNAAIAVQAAFPPYPDIWIPFTENLDLIAGISPGYRTVTVGSETVITAHDKVVNFTRASTATYINKSGVLTIAAVDEPRFEKEGLLIEGPSTNLLPFSSDFPPTVFSNKFGCYNSNLIPTLNSDGTTTFVDNPSSGQTGNGARRMILSSAMAIVTPNTNYTFSVRGKGGSHQLTIYGSATGNPPNVNLTFPEDTFGVATFSFTTNSTVGGTFQCELYANPLGSDHSTYTGSFTLSYVQLEALPFASSYIPTNGASATRARDLASIPGELNIYGLGNNITVSAEISYPRVNFASWPRIIETSTVSENKGFFFARGNSGNMSWGPSLAVDPGAYVLYTATDKGTVGATYYKDANNTITSAEDSAATKGTTLATAYILGANVVSRYFYGNVRNLRVWHRTLTDAQIRGLA